MRPILAVAVLVGVSAALIQLACAPDDDPRKARASEGCTLNSDCNAPLICAFRTCHVECTSSRDCTDGARCVMGERPNMVCQLPDEQSCRTHADCQFGQLCGVDDQCRDSCKTDRDCVSEQVCVLGTCADTRELRDGTLPVAPRADAGADAPRGLGLPCEYTSQCPAPLVCRNATCDHECLGDRDCAEGKTCIAAVCSSTTTPGPCGAGLLACGSDASPTCVDPTRDRANCGACGNACAAGKVCDRGTCALSCPSELTDCSGVCRKLSSDPASCGACGQACAVGKVCSDGACVASCSSPLVECAGGCHDLAVDPLHCGACGTICAAGRACVAGTCKLVCGSGTTACGDVCRDLQIDPVNCGACGNACPSGKSCVSGSCS